MKNICGAAAPGRFKGASAQRGARRNEERRQSGYRCRRLPESSTLLSHGDSRGMPAGGKPPERIKRRFLSEYWHHLPGLGRAASTRIPSLSISSNLYYVALAPTASGIPAARLENGKETGGLGQT